MLALLTSESPRDDCLHSPSCSVPVSNLVAGASEGVILCGCTPVTPYDTSATAASLLTPVQPLSYRRMTVRAGGRAFPSVWHGLSAHPGPATMSEGGEATVRGRGRKGSSSLHGVGQEAWRVVDHTILLSLEFEAMWQQILCRTWEILVSKKQEGPRRWLEVPWPCSPWSWD